MSKLILRLAATTAALCVAACNSAPESDANSLVATGSGVAGATAALDPTGQAMVGEGEGSGPNKPTDCPMMSSSDWAANLSSPVAPETKRVLTVTGKVTVNTGGYKVSLAPGATMEMQPPIQQMILTVTPPAPDKIVTQSVMTLPVKGLVQNAYPAYSAVTITCEKGQVATIKTIGSGE